ncbi:pseudouridine synthase [Massilia yuzhufengensis]|uniref:tRNA pseudouridine32 synthase / 23S rRNA pseudouridine746 synthase n=1 Tax=Massilia yuzhufengensis TaxID=1164594 RepID=A0A1I1KJX3_9BURK|nr:pseudouridine synthase [Massilia yuzhufengensis]SFC61166.1 tRNA pseudouridine32 synthase / 23S rRNA pseudouridine746 synthase [Massilia yuzhufengensis]
MSGSRKGFQAEANAHVPLPIRAGVAPSYLWLTETRAGGLLRFLAERFPDVSEAAWAGRLARGEIVDARGARLEAASPVRQGMRIWYYRELEAPETPIPFREQVLFQDAHLLVADKPHFLPTIPTGRFLHETLLVRLKQRFELPHLTPIHRLDRETAGVVIFSHNPASRGAYQSMFQKRVVNKVYEALAGPIEGRAFPFTYRSRMQDAEQFFLSKEVAGEPNSETLIELLERRGDVAHYRLHPHTGRKHQLRLHLSALGAPILNDAFYPVALPCKGDDFSAPLQLLARSIAFDDPLSGQPRRFDSGFRLAWPTTRPA